MVKCLMTHKFTHKSDRNFFLTTFQEKNDTFSRSRYQWIPDTLRSFDQRIIFKEYFCEIEKRNGTDAVLCIPANKVLFDFYEFVF